jgi:prepilin-type N-terminal cleavage/methylation domain-containing protein
MKKALYCINNKGFTLIEIILAVSVFGMIVVGTLGSILYGQQAQLSSGLRNRAGLIADQTLDIVRSLRDQGMDTLRDGTYGLSPVGITWALVPGGDTVQGFNRTIAITTANGGDEKNIKVTVSWKNDFARDGSVALSMTLTNWTTPIPIIQNSGTRSSASMSVTPTLGINATMVEGSNSISDGTQVYTITNSGSAPMNWTAAYTAPATAVSLSQSSGTLGAGESVDVTASFTSSAYTLTTSDGVGPTTFSWYIAFTNTTNGSGNTTRTQRLTVTTTSALTVTPGTDFNVSGSAPFKQTQVYTISNTGPVPMQWSLTYEQDWMEIEGSLAGTLAGNSSTQVTVKFNSNADALTAGSYSSYINFVNLSSGVGNTTRTVYLTVGGDPGGGGGSVGGKKIWSDNDGQYVYMITTDKKFQVFDVKGNPDEPSLIGEVVIGETLNNLFVKDSYAYVTTDAKDAELVIIDITDQANPTLISTFDTSYSGDTDLNGNDVWVGTANGNDFALLIASNDDGTNSQIETISLSDHTNPTSLIKSDSNGILYEIAAVYNSAQSTTGYALITSDSDTAEVKAYEFKPGTTLGPVATYDIPGKNTPLTIASYYDWNTHNEFIVGNNQTVYFFAFDRFNNVINLLDAFTRGEIKSAIHDIAVAQIDGSLKAFLAVPGDLSSGLKRIDFTDASDPIFDGQVDTQGATKGVTYDALLNYVFGANSSGDFLGVFPRNANNF